MKPTIDRLPYADSAHVEAELHARSRGQALPPPLAHPGDTAACPACGCCAGAGNEASSSPLSAGELDALHFRFWSADHKRFDHIGYAHAVIAACASDAARR